MICKYGIWDDTVPGIVYDGNGISNYAKIQMHLMKDFPRGQTGKLEWEKLLNSIKVNNNKSKYDCIVGVSGGTDSSYLLYLLKKECGLNPLAINLDNGWNSEIAVSNIKKMTNVLNVDLETYVIDYEEIKDLLRVYMIAGLPWIDAPTDLAIVAILYLLAEKENIKYIFVGNDFRSEGKQPTEWTYSDTKQLLFLHRKYGNTKLKTYPVLSLRKFIYLGLLKGIKLIPPYNYLDYQKNAAQKFLMENFNWQYYGEHHYENLFTKFAIGYWQYAKFGIDKRKITYSAQVLNGSISRDVALEIIYNKPYRDDEIRESIDFILHKLSFTHKEFDEIWLAQNKSFRDYPSYYPLVEKYYHLLWPLVSKIVLNKPKIFYELETRSIPK